MADQIHRVTAAQLRKAPLPHLLGRGDNYPDTREFKDRRSKEEHVEAILRAQRLERRHPLGLLKRDELQAICDALASTAAGEGRC